MKKILVNVVFACSFMFLFSSMFLFYYDDFVSAVTSVQFDENKAFPIKECQEWTEDVRDFNVTKGNEAKEITVLMYHRVLDDQDVDVVHLDDKGDLYKTIVLKSEFEKQMKYLKEMGFVTITLEEFTLFMKGDINLPQKSILLTFDDGFKDNYEEVYPVLKAHDFTAINFIVTGLVTEKNQRYQAEKLQYFSVSDIQQSCEVFEFQSHTYNFHKRKGPRKSYLVIKPEGEIKTDLQTSLVNLNGSNKAFAYPYGDYNDTSVKVVDDLGFELAFTVESENAEPWMDMLKIPRKAVRPNNTMEDFKKLLYKPIETAP
ncbi:polysaccharide deacetylase family protein [Pontibacillus yanchengensis]|uniref:Polysaccharide deacetylase family protein n=1 Tax=Pontibacillus yanchengensis TaxID=462910 RepID=A0A6I5A3B9_9BACI|nr:polysaccharide deacetylase family protein [Pontibacillus yanchengensis]MYL33861.1 polysaccharide deacetylase family protein [Pontibacillus yanchengensis]